MKKFLFFAVALMACASVFTSCSKDDDEKELYATLDFEGSEFTALIDTVQYGGPQLYPKTKTLYSWTDATTKLSSKFTNGWGDYQFWGGGIAISNYVDEDIKNHASSAYQLSVPALNGSKQFAVAYCNASMSFADNQARQIKSMMVSPTTYELGVITYGDNYAASLAKSGELTLIITGYNGETETGEVKVDMAKDGVLLTTWKTVDLSSLGKVTSVDFTMTGSDSYEWDGVTYLNSPAYFAFDNVTIVK